MSTDAPERGYSSQVALYLEVDGERLPVAQVERASLVLREPASIAGSSSARVVIIVDEVEELHDVFICHGIENQKQVEFI